MLCFLTRMQPQPISIAGRTWPRIQKARNRYRIYRLDDQYTSLNLNLPTWVGLHHQDATFLKRESKNFNPNTELKSKQIKVNLCLCQELKKSYSTHINFTTKILSPLQLSINTQRGQQIYRQSLAVCARLEAERKCTQQACGLRDVDS